MRTAGERQLSEAGQRHQEEVTRIHQERYDEGHGDGVASMEEEAGQAVERMAALHRSMRHERDQILLEAETLVVDLALALARASPGRRPKPTRKWWHAQFAPPSKI